MNKTLQQVAKNKIKVQKSHLCASAAKVVI